MPWVEFVGDWDPETIAKATTSLRKSLGVGSGGGAEDTVPTTVVGLSPRQKKLLQLLQKAGCPPAEEDPCEPDPPSWDEYPLEKSGLWPGKTRITPDGKVLRLNQNRRWERVDDGIPSGWMGSIPVISGSYGRIHLPRQDGPYGTGVYLPVVDTPGEGLRLRAHLAVDPAAIITTERFEELAADYSQDLDLLLDGYGVKAIVQMERGKVVLVVVRDPRDLRLLGSVGGSQLPVGALAFQVVDVQQTEMGLLLDIEVVPSEQTLQKALGGPQQMGFPSRTELAGSRLLPPRQEVDRQVVREAVAWLRQRGGSLQGLALKRLPGIPDFAPEAVVVAVPGDGVIYLCPGDLSAAMRHWMQALTERLCRAAAAQALPADEALQILAAAAQLTPAVWLAHRLLSIAAAVTLQPNERYLQLLAARGLRYWGSEGAVAACIGEDYRTTITGLEIPNLVTLEWDCACPEYARLGQALVSTLTQNRHGVPSLPQ